MNRLLSALSAFVLLLSLTACGSKTTSGNAVSKADSNQTKVAPAVVHANTDSVQLTALIRKLYGWHDHGRDSEKMRAFEPVKTNPTDSLYSGIDLTKTDETLKYMKSTGMFADEFLNNYRAIAVRMDKELHDGSSEWLVGDMPTFASDADDWCNCQDNPATYPDHLTITSLKITGNQAAFKWTWGDDFYYKVRATKENDQWKIAYLEGFDINKYNWEYKKKNAQ